MTIFNETKRCILNKEQGKEDIDRMKKDLQLMVEENAFDTGSEGGRRPTGDPVSKADTEVIVETKKRRRYANAYKLDVLEKVADLKKTNPGALGEYLRSEGLYYGTVRKWRSLQLEGSLCEYRKGTLGHVRETMSAENAKLRRQLAAMEKKLQQTELLVELQKKVSQLILTTSQKEKD